MTPALAIVPLHPEPIHDDIWRMVTLWQFKGTRAEALALADKNLIASKERMNEQRTR